MAVNETIVTGRKFRKCVDVANKLWQRISFWTKSSDVEFDDGKTAETKVGAIDGITSDLSGESETVAASIKCVNQLNNSLANVNVYVGNDDGKLHFVDSAGADAVIPFSSIGELKPIYYCDINSAYSGQLYSVTKNYSLLLIIGEGYFGATSGGMPVVTSTNTSLKSLFEYTNGYDRVCAYTINNAKSGETIFMTRQNVTRMLILGID